MRSPITGWVALLGVGALAVSSWVVNSSADQAPSSSSRSLVAASGTEPDGGAASASEVPRAGSGSAAPAAGAVAASDPVAATPSAPAPAKSEPAAAAAAAPATSLSPCKDLGLQKAPAGSGKAPIQYAKGWTPGPTKGCTVTDQPGRSFTITAAHNRMLYRVNEMRTIQNKKDGKKRKILGFDFCLQELAQEYTDSKPRGHNPFLMKMYRYPNGHGAATGSSWIGENLGAHGGYTSNKMAQIDRLVYGWYTSGTLTSGHYGNMMDLDWSRAGFGIVSKGSSALSIQNFSADPAYYAYPGGKKCSKPPKKKYGSSTVPPIGMPPD